MKNTEGKPAHCKKCGYDWLTTSENYYVQCPRCRYNVKINPPAHMEREVKFKEPKTTIIKPLKDRFKF